MNFEINKSIKTFSGVVVRDNNVFLDYNLKANANFLVLENEEKYESIMKGEIFLIPVVSIPDRDDDPSQRIYECFPREFYDLNDFSMFLSFQDILKYMNWTKEYVKEVLISECFIDKVEEFIEDMNLPSNELKEKYTIKLYEMEKQNIVRKAEREVNRNPVVTMKTVSSFFVGKNDNESKLKEIRLNIESDLSQIEVLKRLLPGLKNNPFTNFEVNLIKEKLSFLIN